MIVGATFKKIVLILRAILNGILAMVFFGVSLFLPAGTLAFWNAWVFLGLFVLSFLSILIYLALKNPEYAEKRFKANERERPQQVVMSLLVLSAIAMLVVTGFDYRLHWSSVPKGIVILSSILVLAAFVMLFFVMRQNSYASRVVEIQKNQEVIDSGLYSVVRHPMYLAFSVIFVLSPIVLGSWYSLIPAACIPILLTFRISNEEKVLMAGLKGYDAYVKKVRYRLIPFIW